MLRWFGHVVLVLVVFASVLAGRALTQSSAQLPPAAPYETVVDAAKVPALLSRALAVPTISHQDPASGDPMRFEELHDYLRHAFPQVHAVMNVERIGAHSLLYTWKGLDAARKPVMLLAHMDVVPAEVTDAVTWRHPPFSGRISDGHIWGRGALDDKSAVIGLLSAAEALLTDGFQPQTTIYFGFGADEEVGGHRGARAIAQTLEKRDVRLEFVLDEGGLSTLGIIRGISSPVALIGIAQKGYATLELRVQTAGGHSSMPPRNTAIGILAGAVHRLESQPFPTRLTAAVREMFRYLGPEMPWLQRVALSNLWFFPFEKSLLRTLAQKPSTQALVRTTTAFTMIRGGVKENVLPNEARAMVNFRILQGDSAAGVRRHVERTIDDDRVAIRVLDTPQEPSAVSATDTPGFSLVHRSVRAVFPEAVVAPYVVVATTDSRHYAHLADNVYHFRPMLLESEDLKRIHGIDERISVDDLVKGVGFFSYLLRAL